MKVDILTLFPSMFEGPLDHSMVMRARRRGVLELNVRDLRDYTRDVHRTVDDRPFGGGPGMVLKPEPVFEAVESLQGPGSRVILLSPAGRPYRQSLARELSRADHLILLCGSYEGFDERIVEGLAGLSLSIGDYVLTNGALPAMVVVDSVCRLLPGALGDEASAQEESFGEEGLLEHPHYTRPADFRGMKVPDILLSGDHGAIARWRRRMSMERTRRVRPELAPGDPELSAAGREGR